jgi:hypothetical protein
MEGLSETVLPSKIISQSVGESGVTTSLPQPHTTIYSLFNRGLPPPPGTVADEVFRKGISYYGEEASQQIWKSDWFNMKDDEVNSKI